MNLFFNGSSGLHWRLGDGDLENNQSLMGIINLIQIQKMFFTYTKKTLDLGVFHVF